MYPMTFASKLMNEEWFGCKLKMDEKVMPLQVYDTAVWVIDSILIIIIAK